MITLKMKNFNTILIEKLQNYQPDNQEKLIYVNILQMKKCYKKHYLFSFGKSFGKNNQKQLKNKKKSRRKTNKSDQKQSRKRSKIDCFFVLKRFSK